MDEGWKDKIPHVSPRIGEKTKFPFRTEYHSQQSKEGYWKVPKKESDPKKLPLRIVLADNRNQKDKGISEMKTAK